MAENKQPLMEELEFRRRLAATRMSISSRTSQGCRLILVDGLSGYAASAQTGVSEGVLSRALSRLRGVEPIDECPCCGQLIKWPGAR